MPGTSCWTGSAETSSMPGVDHMATFTDNELKTCQRSGVVAFALGVLLAVAASVLLGRNPTAPEHAVFWRATGLMIMLVSALWTALATLKRLAGRS